MPQQQSQKSGEPPIGQCSVCGEPVTRDDPGTLRFSAASGTMANVHTRCEDGAASDESDGAGEGDG
jgi:hypothetical protein